MSADVLRWLLWPLAHPSFLLRLWHPSPAPFLPLFDQLVPDRDHPEAARSAARAWLETHLPVGATPATEFEALVQALSVRPTPFADFDLTVARWGRPALFRLREYTEGGAQGHHELHLHLGGAVPFEALWRRWRKVPQTRRVFQKQSMPDPLRTWVGHGKTWADLIDTLPKRRLTPHHHALATSLRFELMHQRQDQGLAPFNEVYGRYVKTQKHPEDAFAENHDRLVVRAALRPFARQGVALIELRPALTYSRGKLCERIREKLGRIITTWLDLLPELDTPPMLALVPSLLKQEKGTDWQHQQDIWLEQARALLELLDASPLLRRFVAGLDAAGQERGCPPRVFKPIFDLIRSYNTRHNQALSTLTQDPVWLKQNAKAVRDGEAGETLPSRLGLTLHVGEDFADPLTGLRHLGEAIEILDLQPGDRLGHALAAGLDPPKLGRLLQRLHGKAEPTISKPRADHLLDLAWLARILENDAALPPMLVQAMAHTFNDPTHFGQLAEDLFRPGPEAGVRLPWVRYLTPKDVDARDCLHLQLDVLWARRFERARKHVIGLIRERQLVIESCPTSNLSVAGLAEPVTSTFLEIDPPLRVVVATDDPGLFGVWPTEELARFPHHRPRLDRQSESAAFVRRVTQAPSIHPKAR